MRGAVLATAAGALLLALPAAGAPASPADVGAPTDGPAGLPPPALADRDGDGISDHLHHVLADARPTDPVEVIVTLRDGADGDAVRQSAGLGEVQPFSLIDGFAATVTANQARRLAALPDVFRVDADFVVTTQLDASNRDFGATAARAAFDVDGSGVGICVVDTGVDPGHEQFASKTPIPFFDAINGQTTAYDDHGHGTHVANIALGDGVGGSAAATFGGVAPGAALYAAKVLSGSGSGTASQIIAGIEWCADQPGVGVMNLSLGTPAASDGLDSISQAVDAAVAQGKVTVVAAGNRGDAPETVGSPGAAAGAITAGAAAEWSAPPGTTRRSHGVYLAEFSSRGPTLAGTTAEGDDWPPRIKPDITAPGVTVTAAQAGTAAGYATFSGTSMASPYVAGLVALALEADPDLAPHDVARLLERSAHDRATPGKDNDWGAGVVDGYGFVASLSDLLSFAPTAFPLRDPVGGAVADHSTWTREFEVAEADLDVPIAATIVIDGALECVFFLIFCWQWAWLPDLDAELVDPGGSVIAASTCPAGCSSGSVGRQETLAAMPTVAGTYTVVVAPYGGSPNDGRGGTFVVDLSHGPPGGGLLHPGGRGGDGRATVEAVQVGALTATATAAGGSWQAAVDVTVHTAGGAPFTAGVATVVGRWDDGTAAACVTEAGACTIVRDGLARAARAVTYTVEAVGAVTDDGVRLGYDAAAGTTSVTAGWR